MKVGLGFVWVGLLQILCLWFVFRTTVNLSEVSCFWWAVKGRLIFIFLYFYIFLFLNTGKYSSWTKEDSKDTNISILSQQNAGCCSLFVHWQHAWKQGHHAGMGGMLCSASSPARQAISAGVIGKGCRRQAKGHSSLASFLKRLLSTRKCP